MIDWECVYRRLPIPFQNAACGIVGWRILQTRYGSGFVRQLRKSEQRGEWSDDRIREYRNTHLREFVEHCAKTVPYYQNLFQKEGIDPKRIRNEEDLKQIPALTREEVQQNIVKLRSSSVSRRQCVQVHTSGTTGGGLTFASTLDGLQQQWATWWRYRRWHGIQMGTHCGYWGGRIIVPIVQKSPPYWRYNRPGKQILFSGYHMGPDTLDYYIEELRSKRPPWIHGYPSAISLLASYLLNAELNLGYQLRSITVGAENLLNYQATRIEHAFGVRPCQHYGMTEAVANISQCELGTLHVDEDFSFVEFLPEADGLANRIIGTNFTNLATPLLRYDTGDTAVLGKASCPCGRPGRVVERIDGRRDDYIVLKNGVQVGRADHIFKDMVNVLEAQIYQGRAGEITLRIVRNRSYGARDEQLLLKEVRNRFGEYVEASIEYVEALDRTHTGKLRFVVSDIESYCAGELRQ
jgi:phenylacetate-CoA ligase